MTRPALRTQLPGFLTVGALGFLVDAGVFQLLFLAGKGPVAARIMSASVSISTTWYLNRQYVFRTADASSSVPEYTRYIGVQTIGLAVNFGVYFALLAAIPLMRAQPILALCGGAAAALVLNFLGARYFAFRTNWSDGQAR
jgi:putative flippase GtrA